jgi:YVTN family beta-propeller protein
MRNSRHSARIGLVTGTVLAATMGVAALVSCPEDARNAPLPDALHNANAELVVYVVAPDESSAIARGALLAGAEAARAATLMSRTISVMVVPDVSALAAVSTPAVVLVGGRHKAECSALDAHATRRGWLYMNVACTGAWLRDPGEHPAALHVAPTLAMGRGLNVADDSAASSGVLLWRDDLERYGAAQLNARYRERFGAPMNDSAWGAWMAVKAVSEAMLRGARPASTGSLLSYMTRLDVAFDGHKGEPLRFGADDHQLRQPVYAATPSHAADAPISDSAAVVLPYTPIPEDVSLVVVSNEGSSSLSVVDAGTHRVLGVIPLPNRPRGIHADRNGRHVLVALSDLDPNSEGDGDVVAVVDVRRGQIVSRIRGGSDPEQFALIPRSDALLIANEDAGLATIAPRDGGDIHASLAVGIEPEGVAVSPDGAWGYVTAETSNTVSVIDLRRRALVGNFLVDVRPRAVAVHPNGLPVYVSNEISGTISVVEPSVNAGRSMSGAALNVTRTIDVGGDSKPVGLLVTPDGQHLLVALGGAHAVAVIDTRTWRETRRIPVGRRPWNLTASADGKRLFVANGASGTLSVIDGERWRVVATVPVGERPWGVAWVAAAR